MSMSPAPALALTSILLVGCFFAFTGQTTVATTTGSGSPFGLAWFHKPPEDGTTASQLAAEHAYIHLTGPSDFEFRAELRAAGYTGPIYNYVTALGVEGPGPYKNSADACDASYEPYDNNVAWNVGDFCTYIHPNESWFLHNGAGERLLYDYFGNGRYTYLMNPSDPGWRAFSHGRLLRIRDEWGYDGLWLDNLDLDRSRATQEVANSDGTVQEYPTDAAWRTAVQGWLSGLRATIGPYPVWANLIAGGLGADSWDPYAPYLDGAMDESFSVRWVDGWLAPSEWTSQMERAEGWLASGKGLVTVGQGQQADEGRMRFTLASYMLIAGGGEAFYRYSNFATYYNQLWLYPDFDAARALGTPTGPRQEVSPGVWRRSFANGYVQVNPAAHTGQVVLLSCDTTFADVPEGSTFYEHVSWMACRSYINGYPCGGDLEPCPGTYFRPGAPVTRGQMLKMVVNTAGWPLLDPPDPTFADVSPGSAFYTFVETGVAHGIIGGYPCGRPGEPCDEQDRPYFRPGGNITRGQLSKVIALARGYDINPGSQFYTFADVPTSHPFHAYVEAMSANGIISGYACGTPGEECDAQHRPFFRPSGTATRGQVSKFIAVSYGGTSK